MGSKNSGSRRAAAGYKAQEVRSDRRTGKMDLRRIAQQAAAGHYDDEDEDQVPAQQMQAGFTRRPGSGNGR